MSIVKAVTNPYGPATLDIQIEQGATFTLPMNLQRGGGNWDLTNATFDAHFSLAWSPGEDCVDLTVTVNADPTTGNIEITFPAASSLALQLPSPPRKTTNQPKFELGGWLINITDGGVTQRLAEGKVYFDRDPCR